MKDFNSQAFECIEAYDSPRVVEIGTLRSNPEVSTHHQRFVPHASEFVMVDIEEGLDVDVVADAHFLTETFGPERFDVYLTFSTLEHLRWPWKWAKDVETLLAPGGLCVASTHQTFPLHAYPHDYFRFSTDAFYALFDDTDLTVVATGYQFPCKIVPPAEVKVWNTAAPAHLNVWALIAKQ